MATKNPITGDALITKVNNKAYEDNYDKIFGKGKQLDLFMTDEEQENIKNIGDNPLIKRSLDDVTPEEWDAAARKVREQDAKAKQSS